MAQMQYTETTSTSIEQFSDFLMHPETLILVTFDSCWIDFMTLQTQTLGI